MSVFRWFVHDGRDFVSAAPLLSVILRRSAQSDEPRRTTATAPRPHPSRAATRPPQDDGKEASTSRSRDAAEHPSFTKSDHVKREGRARSRKQGWCLPWFFALAASQIPPPVPSPASGGGSGRGQAKNERKKFGGETPTDAMSIMPCLRARPRLHREAHGCRRSTAAFAKGTFVVFGATPGQASWDVACLLSGRYPPLPVPKSSEQLAPRS